ncbi:thioredoxin family protein [Desulfoluna sp.]|uniref:thioredoxin family protein n=1 Tax=Desulfoluna sp. TaxID=2045199 RepID=UPI002639DF19|nr:thioredoxin family protein [Desulfoluna sp.]
MPETITRLRVGTNAIGIIGLTYHLAEVAKSHGEASDTEITEALFTRLKKRNFIAPGVSERYRHAFFKAYLNFTGRELPGETEETGTGPLSVLILGTGCARCETLESDVRQILSETGITAECDHLRDPGEIAAYGCFAYPGLVINDQLKLAGRVPTQQELKTLLEKAS